MKDFKIEIGMLMGATTAFIILYFCMKIDNTSIQKNNDVQDNMIPTTYIHFDNHIKIFDSIIYRNPEYVKIINK
jgi:hypothetical protein